MSSVYVHKMGFKIHYLHALAYNYVDDPEHEKHWFVRSEPRQFDATAEAEIDRHDGFF